MSEPTEQPPLAPPPPATSSGNETDDALHHRSISDEAPSPSPPPSSAAAGAAAAAAAKASAAKASASAFASKIAFGGRKFLSPLANVTGVGASSNAPAKEVTASSSVAAASSGDARSEVSSSPSPQKSGGAAAAGAAAGAALVSSLAGANAAVSDAASAVTSSLGYLLTNVAATASAAVTTTPDSSSTTSSSSAPLDAAELEQLEAEFQQATAQQRMKVLEDLVQYRRADWNYLKAMHQGTNYWLNVALVRETQMLAHLGERAAIRRSVQFFYLGLGLGKVLSEVRHAHAVPLAGAQLLEELEYYFASATVQSMKLLVATSQPTLHVPLEKKENENDGHGDPLVLEEPFRPTIYKWNQRPVFRWLVTPSIVRAVFFCLFFVPGVGADRY
jgi:hypothetical protein